MPAGPGKYDDLCSYAIQQAQAQSCALIVFGGNQGSGFSVQGNLEALVSLPATLRAMATEIERTLPQMPEVQAWLLGHREGVERGGAE